MAPALPIDSEGDAGDLSFNESQTAISEAHRGQQRAFERAAQALASRDRACAGDPASFGVEIANLEKWARETQSQRQLVDVENPLAIGVELN